MSDLDSRQLRAFDSFGQKFSKTGTHKYGLGTGAPGGTQSFTIEVDKPGPAPAQHLVVVSYVGGQLKPDQDPLKIASGDVVTWKNPTIDDPPFSVIGTGPNGDVGNGKMMHEAIYTHTFVSPRTYQWQDANGAALRGSVNVSQVEAKTPADYAAWLDSIKTGPVIRVVGAAIQNGDVQVPVGGTVCWTVENTGGVAVVDALLPSPKLPPAGGGPGQGGA